MDAGLLLRLSEAPETLGEGGAVRGRVVLWVAVLKRDTYYKGLRAEPRDFLRLY